MVEQYDRSDAALQGEPAHQSGLANFASDLWHNQSNMFSNVVHGRGTLGEDGLAAVEVGPGYLLGTALVGATLPIDASIAFCWNPRRGRHLQLPVR